MRIEHHPIFGEVKRGKQISFEFDGQRIAAYEDETIAAALWAADIKTARYTAKRHEPRGVFCAIGYCSDCMMIVDGVPNTRSCVTPVRDGMVVQLQDGLGDWGKMYE